MARVANSLETLRKQLNEIFPTRNKASDGGVSDDRHKTLKSDHNENFAGVVTARDFTHEKATLDCQKLAAVLVRRKDPRIKYIIWNKQICSSKQQPWVWRKYSGANAHTKHLHISVNAEPKLYDDKTEWNLDGLTSTQIAILDVPASNSNPSHDSTNDATNASESNTTPMTGDGSGNSIPIASTTQETTHSATVEQGDTTVKKEITTVNQQSVDEVVAVPAPPPANFLTKLSAGIGTLFSGTIIFTVLEKLGAMSFSQTALILICFVVFLAFVGFIAWYVVDSWKKAQKVKVEAMINTDINRKNMVWKQE